jgi:hypothetical protein
MGVSVEEGATWEMPFPLLPILLVLVALVVLFAVFLVVRRWLWGREGSPVFEGALERVCKQVNNAPGGARGGC